MLTNNIIKDIQAYLEYNSAGLLHKVKIGKTNYYINTALVELFINRAKAIADIETIESVL